MRSFGGAGAGPFTISPTGSGSIHELKFTYAHWPSQEGTVVRREIRIAGDTMNRNVLRPDGTKADTEVHQKVDGDWSSPTADVWELASDEWAGFMMMTDAQYRYLVTRRDRPALPRRPRDMKTRTPQRFTTPSTLRGKLRCWRRNCVQATSRCERSDEAGSRSIAPVRGGRQHPDAARRCGADLPRAGIGDICVFTVQFN